MLLKRFNQPFHVTDAMYPDELAELIANLNAEAIVDAEVATKQKRGKGGAGKGTPTDLPLPE